MPGTKNRKTEYIHKLSDEARLRRYENNMVISAYAVIAFGAWSIIKTAVYLILNPLNLNAYLDQASLDELQQLDQTGETIGRGFFIITLFLVLVIDLLLRLYVARSAIADSRRKKKKRSLYIVIACFMLLGLICSTCTWVATTGDEIASFLQDPEGWEKSSRAGTQTEAASGLLDLTSAIAVWELIWSSSRVRRIRRRAKRASAIATINEMGETA